MKKLLLIFFVIFSANAKSQEVEFQDFTAYYLFNIGYTYQNNSYFEVGSNVYLVRPNNDIVDLGATLNFGASNGNFLVIPEAQIGYLWNLKNSAIDPYSSNFNSAFWMVRTSVSPWHITPEVGITVLSLIDFSVGYGFEFSEHKNVDLEGLKLGLSIRLPFLLFWNE